jgi:hypothetical protein
MIAQFTNVLKQKTGLIVNPWNSAEIGLAGYSYCLPVKRRRKSLASFFRARLSIVLLAQIIKFFLDWDLL